VKIGQRLKQDESLIDAKLEIHNCVAHVYSLAVDKAVISELPVTRSPFVF